jgi:hypothetical protein
VFGLFLPQLTPVHSFAGEQVQASAVDATSPFDAMLCVDCALIADVGASPRDANRGSADWHLLAVERLHAALAFIAVNLLFDVDS